MRVPEPVRIGGVDRVALREHLARAGVKLNESAEELFRDVRFQTAGESSLVDVVVVDVSGLGFPSGATFEQLTAAASREGLALCPLELGPHLRLQFIEQDESPGDPADSRGTAPPGAITVASAPPTDDQVVPWGFYLRRTKGELWLRGYHCWSGHVWAPSDALAFRDRRFRAAGGRR